MTCLFKLHAVYSHCYDDRFTKQSKENNIVNCNGRIYVTKAVAECLNLCCYDVLTFHFTRNFLCKCVIISENDPQPTKTVKGQNFFNNDHNEKNDRNEKIVNNFTRGNKSYSGNIVNQYNQVNLISESKVLDKCDSNDICGECLLSRYHTANYNVFLDSNFFYDSIEDQSVDRNVNRIIVRIRKYTFETFGLELRKISLRIDDVSLLSTNDNDQLERVKAIKLNKNKWDAFDLLHDSKSNYILRESLQGTIVDVNTSIKLCILGSIITFKLNLTEMANDHPVYDKCFSCVTLIPKIYRLAFNLDVHICPPIDINELFRPDNSSSDLLGLCNIGGYSSVVNSLRNMLVLPLILPSSFDQLDIPLPKGIIIHGPAGVGKSHILKCVSEELLYNWQDICNQHSNMNSEIQNVSRPHVEFCSHKDLVMLSSTQYINGIFKRCLRKIEGNCSGCIIIIDDFDMICSKTNVYDNDDNQIIDCFIDNIYRLPPKSKIVILISATNIENIPVVLKKSKRFDREIEIDIPNAGDRASILKKILTQTKNSLTEEDIDNLSWECSAFVASDLVSLLNLSQSMIWNDLLEKHVHNSSFKNGTMSPDCLLSADILSKALVNIKPSGMKEVAVEIPSVKWTDIGGYDKVKLILQQCVEWPIKYHKIFTQFNVEPPKGVLMYGPPGCSKTLLAKAIATESKMNFIAVKGPELFSKWVGDSEKAVRDVFRKARQNSPCVIFFDEIDALGVDRDSMNSSSGVESRVLSQMLNEMDGIQPVKQVIVIGATNRPNLLDAALLRPGRLDRLVYVPLPDFDSRKSIFSVHLRTSFIDSLPSVYYQNLNDIPLDNPITPDLLPLLSQATEGLSGAEIAMICRETVMLAVRNHIESLENKNDSNNVNTEKIQIVWKHLKQCLTEFKPRISPSLVEFYENYSKQHESYF